MWNVLIPQEEWGCRHPQLRVEAWTVVHTLHCAEDPEGGPFPSAWDIRSLRCDCGFERTFPESVRVPPSPRLTWKQVMTTPLTACSCGFKTWEVEVYMRLRCSWRAFQGDPDGLLFEQAWEEAESGPIGWVQCFRCGLVFVEDVPPFEWEATQRACGEPLWNPRGTNDFSEWFGGRSVV